VDLGFSETQRQFRATLRRFMAGRAGRPVAECWSGLAELGALAALIPEAYGGVGGDCIDAIVILEELGRGLTATPIIETVLVAAGLIERLGSPRQKQEWLPAIAAGRVTFAFADGGYPAASRFSAERDAAGFRLAGRQDGVAYAPACDRLLVLATEEGAAGPTLFQLDPSKPRIRAYRTIDDRTGATIELGAIELAEAHRIGPHGGAGEAVAELQDLAVIGLCAEAVGIMAALLNQTIAHLKTRTQFGRPLADFQALQHRLADMYMAYELAVSQTYKAAILYRDRSADRPAAVSAAKILATEAARLIGHEAIQFHGAIGMSLELPIGHAVKRLKAMEPQYGSARTHLRRWRALERTGAA
jgi:alkylation response protein AidB-like acyl-CoA dehydrogenase